MRKWALTLLAMSVQAGSVWASPSAEWGRPDGPAPESAPLLVRAVHSAATAGPRTPAARAKGALAERAPRGSESERAAFGHGGMVRGSGAVGYVAFTFDDGPDIEHTPRVLDTLDRYGIPATFFLVGNRLAGTSEKAAKRRAIAADIAARGHDIGNHTFRHPNLRTLPRAKVHEEIVKAERYIGRALGHRPFLFRAPYGKWSAAAAHQLTRRGYTRIGWSFDVRDFRGKGQLAQRTLDAIEQHGSGIVLLHDPNPNTANALPAVFVGLMELNCERMAAGRAPIVPVSLDFFVRNGARRPLRAHTIRREEAYLGRLQGYCANAAKSGDDQR